MGSQLPFLTEAEFRQRLSRFLPSRCPESTPGSLFPHYRELCRWNPRLSLVGPGTAGEVVERHYGESLAALPLIHPTDQRLLDIGAGAGFPGMVLAAALPALRVALVEPRERKWAFLKTASRRCGLSIQCLNARVERPLSPDLPRNLDVVTCRAVAISPGLMEVLREESPQVRFLIWCGAGKPELPEGWRVVRETALAGSRFRRILQIEPTTK